MSAFFVTKNVIDHINTARRMLCEQIGVKISDDELTAFGRAIWLMNVDALKARYPKDDWAEERKEAQAYSFRDRSGVSKTQMYKSCRCLIYQCSEGNVPNTQTFKDVNELSCDLAHHILTRTSEYDRCAWSGPAHGDNAISLTSLLRNM